MARRVIVTTSSLRLAAMAALLCGVAAGTASLAAATRQTIKVLEVDSSFVGTGGFDANGNMPPTAGQGVVIKGSLYKIAGHKQGARYGDLQIGCTFTNGTGASVCTSVLSLPAGKIVASGSTPGNSSRPYTFRHSAFSRASRSSC
jgi:hypothetical protein